MNFDFDNNIPIYLQLVEQIKVEIISGKIKAGERLPSVRDMAVSAKVNPNTMQKALSELEDTGLVFTERTNGRFVTEDRDLIERYKKDYAKQLAKSFFESMECLGYNQDEACEYLRNIGGNE